MSGKAVKTETEERKPECLFGKIQKLMRKTRRSMGRNVELYVINVTPREEQPAEFHTREELTIKQRENSQLLICDDFPELLQPMDSPHVSQ
jgi:hypothetical protein